VHCDEEWEVQGIAGGFISAEAAKSAAERMYGGASSQWIDTGYSEANVATYLEEIYTEQNCSFCGRRPDQVQSIVNSDNANICDICIREFSEALRNDV
jgi:hypothetical protein